MIVRLVSESTFQDLKEAVAQAASVGPFAFKLCTEDGTILVGDPFTSVRELCLQNGAALTVVTECARDYSGITGPEKVISTERYPAGVLIDRNGMLFVSHYFGLLSLYDADFNLVRQTRLPLPEPKQLALAPSGELVIGFPTTIGVFDIESCNPHRWFGDFGRSRGLAVEGNLVFVSDSVRDTINVYRFEDGELLSTYSPGLNEPCGLTVVDGRLLALADRGHNRVLLLDVETFRVHSQLPREGAPKDHALSAPNDVKVDGGGNLLVMDTGHERIAVFREDGSLVASVMQGFF